MTVVGSPAPKLTAELFTVPLEGGSFLVYAPLRRAAFVAPARVVNLLADIGEGTFEEAADPGGAVLALLRELEIVDGGEETPPITRAEGSPSPTSITLLLTTACNLRCTYCYASAGDTPLRSMSLDVALRGIDFVIGNAARQAAPFVEIAYHGGGEPTVHWSVMTASLDYARSRARDHGLGVRASSATNGVLRDDQIDWIIANLDGVSLSFDGLPEVHDRHRLTVLGRGSSDRVMHTLERFDAAGFPYGVRVTVTADQIARLPESIDYLCRRFHPRQIQVEPAYQLGRWRHAPSAETAEFIAAFREAERQAARYGREITYSAARVGTLTNHFCGITQDAFSLSPDGNVSACYEVFAEDRPWADTFFYATPDDGDGYRFDLDRLERLRRQTVEHREFCRGCFARWSCAGDCHHKWLDAGGGGEFDGSDRCHITRELTKDQILGRIARSGGLYWKATGEERDPVEGSP